MPDFEVQLTPSTLGSMNDRLDPAVHREGMATELRDDDLRRGLWEHRLGWARINLTQLPCDNIIGGRSLRNVAGILHTVVAGSDGKLYHGLGEQPSVWDEVVVYADVAPVWDATFRAKFARWENDIFIAFWQPREVATIPPAGTQNLRFNTLSGVAYGVGLAKPLPLPALQMVAADGGVGNILPATRSYKITFLDDTTGWPSDESGVTTIILEDPPAPSSMLTTEVLVPTAGNIAQGSYEYFTTIYDSTTQIESNPSAVQIQRITAAEAPANIGLSNIETCKAAGTWQRRIWRRDNGGGGEGYTGFKLLATLANNTATTYTDNNATAGGVGYSRTGRRVDLTLIPLYAGGGTPANGRIIHRQIWASDDGQPYTLLTTLTNNAVQTYQDNTAALTGEPYVRRLPIPAMGFVERLGGGIVWAHDMQNALPARVILVKNDAEPEAIGGERLAGTHDDPITGLVAARAATFVSKLRAWHRLDPTCQTCDEFLTGSGSVADQGNHYLDTRMPFLSPEGPRLLKLYGESDAPFLGSDGERFCLSEMWRLVAKERLPYCAGIHWRAAGVVMWGVTLCAEASPIRTNDTVIVWDYASISPVNPGGTIYILSLVGWDCGWVKPGLAAACDEPWGGFATGWVGQLFHGKHGDGTSWSMAGSSMNLVGTVLAVSGNIVDVQYAGGVPHGSIIGSILYINGGTGTRMCRPVEACENQRSLIVDQVGGQCGGRLVLAGQLAIDTTSKFWIGGFPQIIEGMINPQEDRKATRQWDSITVYTVPDTP